MNDVNNKDNGRRHVKKQNKEKARHQKGVSLLDDELLHFIPASSPGPIAAVIKYTLD